MIISVLFSLSLWTNFSPYSGAYWWVGTGGILPHSIGEQKNWDVNFMFEKQLETFSKLEVPKFKRNLELRFFPPNHTDPLLIVKILAQ